MVLKWLQIISKHYDKISSTLKLFLNINNNYDLTDFIIQQFLKKRVKIKQIYIQLYKNFNISKLLYLVHVQFM